MSDAAAAEESAWRAVEAAGARLADTHMRDLFAANAQRFERFSLAAAGLFLDYSKNRLDEAALQDLLALARLRQVEAARAAMFAGEKINRTEGRAVLHTALRAAPGSELRMDGVNVIREVEAVRTRFLAFAEAVRSGAWTGGTGRPIAHIVNIGIGGSDLGPRLVADALAGAIAPHLSLHYVSNVDGEDLARCLDGLDPHVTLFIIASKTFTTLETMMNARDARAWFLERGGSEAAIARHFVAVSTNEQGASDFGIAPDNVFGFWDWVGGRFSLWSAIGLSLAIGLGAAGFERLLAGARAMDDHFRSSELERNMPVILALTEIWNRNAMGFAARAVVPYDRRLALLPDFLQQLEMESNGKSVTSEGKTVPRATAPVVWGGPGTDGQHAYFQKLHQGTDIVPVDFIACLKPGHGLAGHHRALMANLFAQAHALMAGRPAPRGAPHRHFAGNRPSNLILMETLDADRLGALIALYEHKVFVEGVLWNVPSFDQWGVELGKEIAKGLLAPGAAPANTGVVGHYNARVEPDERLAPPPDFD